MNWEEIEKSNRKWFIKNLWLNIQIIFVMLELVITITALIVVIFN